MNNWNDVTCHRPFEAEIDAAITRGELFFLHQPQVDLVTGQVTGSEALIRWNHRELGILAPGRFLPRLAEASSLDGLTDFAVESAIAQWKAWVSVGLILPISVNVTPLVLASDAFPLRVARAVEAAALPDDMLRLEITEETLIADGRRAAEVIEFLGGCGVGFSIDDFGAGYSSLSHLLEFDIREVKIDRCFVEAMPGDQRARRIVRALAKLAAELGIATVGEGVSSPAIVDTLLAAGCRIGQGFHLARPMPAGDLPAFVATSRAPQGAEATGGATLLSFPDIAAVGRPTNEQTR